MATREEYIAGAAAIAKIAETYIDQIPSWLKDHIPMDKVNAAINAASVAAIDAAEAARAKPVT